MALAALCQPEIADRWSKRHITPCTTEDLKIGKFTHADAGQMNLYLNYAKEHWTMPGENPPVGLILCSEQDDAVAHYSLDGLQNKVLARKYQMTLPNESQLVDKIRTARQSLLDVR